MANVGKPPSRKGNRKGTPPKAEITSVNLTKTSDNDIVGISFKIPGEFRKEMKQYAAELGISMTELLVRAIKEYKERH